MICLKAPENYLSAILQKFNIEKNINKLACRLIEKCSESLHLIIDENEIDVSQILIEQCKSLKSPNLFDYKLGLKVFYSERVYKIDSREPLVLCCLENKNKSLKRTPKNPDFQKIIPLSNSTITQSGRVKKRIDEFKEKYNDDNFYCNEKLLVIGQKKVFGDIPSSQPACFVFKNENGEVNIEYNSPILPKIVVLKNINLIDDYLEEEINGENVKFSACIFVGTSRFEGTINSIRNCFNQRQISKFVFIGDKDVDLNLGNNQKPLKWKITIPELNYLNDKKKIKHKLIIVENDELDIAIDEFYKEVMVIEKKYTVGLKSIYRFVRRLYYDWHLKPETTTAKFHQIQKTFDIALGQLLIERIGNISPDGNFDEFQKLLSEKFSNIIGALKINNKVEYLKTHKDRIHQLITPSFKCLENREELKDIMKQIKSNHIANSLQEIPSLQKSKLNYLSDIHRNYFALTANGQETECLSLAKSDLNASCNKIITSIYGSGEIEKLIERLAQANSEYKLLLYNIEEKALNYHIEKYLSSLDKEYNSRDRFKICNVEFHNDYYQLSNYDDLIEAISSTKSEVSETDNYKIIFSDDSKKMTLPSTKTVLKIVGTEKKPVSVGDLNIGDKVRIYSNPDKKLLSDILELKNESLVKASKYFSSLWHECLYAANKTSILGETLYQRLVKNNFSVSETTFQKYLDGEVMFPRSFSTLLIIAKTINDARLTFDKLQKTIIPKIKEYRAKEIEYGRKFSNSINQFIISGEIDEFIAEWQTREEIESIVSQIPERIIKDIKFIEDEYE